MLDIKDLKSQAYGITRKIDDVGRVTIPSDIRDKMEMEIGDKVEIFAVKGGILLVKSEGDNTNE